VWKFWHPFNIIKYPDRNMFSFKSEISFYDEISQKSGNCYAQHGRCSRCKSPSFLLNPFKSWQGSQIRNGRDFGFSVDLNVITGRGAAESV
jgi:hypothetical protein